MDEGNLPRRKIIRAEFHDYSRGDFFITICTWEKLHYFGFINEDGMNFTELGKVAQENLQNLSHHYKYATVPLFVVMPNHIHAIIRIDPSTEAKDSLPQMRTILGVVVGGYKQSVTRYARRHKIEFGWQPRYHDHIIRGNQDGPMIVEYIMENVAKWSDDCYAK